MKETNKYNFCTLFETNYLSRGLALYKSLEEHCPEFHLFIVAFNDKSWEILKSLELDKATIISLQEFENEALLSVKDTRSVGEYCWTCTSSVIKYCIQNYKLDHCTYLDADLYFFGNPKALFNELNDHSILITEHRYTPKYDQSEMSGKYCVQFMYFKNDEAGMKCLNWWIDACIDWCYAIPEDGKFGDQKYLDDWLVRFEKVHELQHLGGGVAPWNVQQYQFKRESNGIIGTEIKSKKSFDLIFFHFHDVKFQSGGKVDLGLYTLTSNDRELLYRPYLNQLLEIEKELKAKGIDIDPHGIKSPIKSLRKRLKNIKRRFEKNYNIFDINQV